MMCRSILLSGLHPAGRMLQHHTADSGGHRGLRTLLWGLAVTAAVVSGVVFSPQQEQDVVHFVQSLRQCRGIAGVTSAVVRGNDTWTRGFGLADRETGRDVSTSDLFGIGSLTKAFTAALLCRLIEISQGSYSWNTTVAEILGEEFQLVNEELTSQVTLQDMLTHRTGLDNTELVITGGQYQRINTTEKFLRELRHLGVKAPFRKYWLYNSWLYGLAGRVAERMAGGNRSWGSLVTAHLLQPLGMRHTVTQLRDALAQQRDHMARPYVWVDGDLAPSDPVIYNLGPLDSAGTIASSAEDMVRWMQLFLKKGRVEGRQLFTEDQITQMTSPIMDIDMTSTLLSPASLPVNFTSRSYGLGWFNSIYRGHRVIWHSGGLWAYISYVFLMPDLNLGVFISSNGPGDLVTKSTQVSMETFLRIADLLLGEQPWLSASTACRSPNLWRDIPHSAAKTPVFNEYTNCTFHNRSSYVGDYEHPLFGPVSVSETGSEHMAVKYGLIEGRLCRNDTGTDNVLGFKVTGKMAFFFNPKNVTTYLQLNFTRFSEDKYQEVIFNGPKIPAVFNRSSE